MPTPPRNDSTAIDPAGPFVFSIVAATAANVVLDRVLLYPSDHVHGADRDVVRLLKEARLPLLRWPGGNFTSGYHWRDGIGPVDSRPTTLNPVWHGIFEPNLFGTDEFLTFCRDVGCEPMICVNAGNGTAAGAAAWVEYCNGGPETPMGKLRAANGHPEPYGVRIWEIGNEIYGHWHVGWTTPAGNVDRYGRFMDELLVYGRHLLEIVAQDWIALLGCHRFRLRCMAVYPVLDAQNDRCETIIVTSGRCAILQPVVLDLLQQSVPPQRQSNRQVLAEMLTAAYPWNDTVALVVRL